MFDDECFDEFYAKLNDIVNSVYNLGEIYDQRKIVRKILRSLTEDFRLKVTVIIESKYVDSIPIDELVESLQSYELDTFLLEYQWKWCSTLNLQGMQPEKAPTNQCVLTLIF